MRQSHLFTKTRREAPKDEVSKNAQLLIRAGYIHKEMAGVYAYLPLGLLVLNKIKTIIQEEMNRIGGQEIFLTTLQDKNLWQKTNRWDDKIVDNWFKTKLKNDSELGLGFSHEEPLTQIIAEYVSSYRDLPIMAYQFQNKFRNELRAKSGIMRGREFMMKDAYTFARTEKEHRELYEKAKQAYVEIFKRVGLGEVTHATFASGGVFSQFSEEFQAVSDAGEDLIYIDEKSGRVVNKEVLQDDILNQLGIKRENLVEKKSIEVGNIFDLSSRFSDALGLTYNDEKGEKKSVIMGCYGIGLGRVMGTVVEVLSDDKGIIWPENISPFKIHLILIPGKDNKARDFADDLYKKLSEKNIEVLYDDRDARAGEKFADSDLIGIPHRIVISDKVLEIGAGKLEYKKRGSGDSKGEMKTVEEIMNL